MVEVLIEVLKVCTPIVVSAMLTMAVRWYLRRPEADRDLIDTAVETAVYAVEQMSKSERIQHRRALAAQMAAQELRRYGLEVSADELDSAVESAVYRLLNRWKELRDPVGG